MTKRMAAFAAAFTAISLCFPAIVFRAQAAAPTATDAEPKRGLPSNPKAAQPDAGHDNVGTASIEGFDDILPPLSITEARLEDVLAKINDGLPGFNAIVLREPGVPSDYPKLRNLNVNHITLSQFMVFLDKSFGSLNVTLIPGQGTSGLWVIHVHEDQGSEDAKASATAKAGGPMAPPEANAIHVSVFPLREVIPEIASHQNDVKYTQKQAMDDILSLLQAALKAEASGTPAEIQVHEATEMLVVKGSAAQVQLVAETLGAFAPTDQEKKIQALQQRYDRENAQEQQNSQFKIERLQEKLEDLRQQLGEEKAKATAFALQAENAQRALDVIHGAATKPKE